jgi:predicted DNA-binding transcriptional regulator YafY
LLDGWKTRLTGFTPAEAEALLLAGAGEAAADLGFGAAAGAAQLKLLASLPADTGASAQRVARRFHLDPVGWYARAEAPEILPALAGAVWRERRIRVRYESWKDTVERRLDPLGLVLKGGVWYLVAAAGGKPRTYRVSNILELAVEESASRRPPRFDLARYWKTWARDFEARLLRQRATIRISPAGRALLRDLNPAASQAVEAEHRPCKPAGWVEAEIPVEGDAYAAGQLLRLGAEVEVRAPPTLRAAVAGEAARVARLYARS